MVSESQGFWSPSLVAERARRETGATELRRRLQAQLVPREANPLDVESLARADALAKVQALLRSEKLVRPWAWSSIDDAESFWTPPTNLKIAPELLRRRGLERRVAGWARAYCGTAAFPTYRLSLAKAYRKAGSTDAPRKLLHALRRLVVANPLDGCRLEIVPGAKREDLLIERVPPQDTRITFAMVIKLRLDEPDPSNLERSEPCA